MHIIKFHVFSANNFNIDELKAIIGGSFPDEGFGYPSDDDNSELIMMVDSKLQTVKSNQEPTAMPAERDPDTANDCGEGNICD
jgi:hypothetical protein